ncbi:MAG: DNA-binding response regulator [Candidatus Hydrogenedentota bacterium]|nr:MAG: DNA-binding response regulator [Candidatus Hydrogenedentota bacterium]
MYIRKSIKGNLMRIKIILVEDDDNIRELLEMNLKQAGFSVQSYFSAEKLLSTLVQKEAHAYLLDIHLPGINGIELAKKIHEKYPKAAILFLTAMQKDTYLPQALQTGAIDYIEKPFDIDLLIAKLKNLIQVLYALPTTSFQIGNIKIYLDTGMLVKGKEKIKLSMREKNILQALLKNPGQIVSRKDLMISAASEQEKISSRYLDNIIANLRQYFNDKENKLIVTYPKEGYAFEGKIKEIK